MVFSSIWSFLNLYNMLLFYIRSWLTLKATSTVVKITVRCQLKSMKSRQLLTKKVTENTMLTHHFIIFYCSCEDWLLMFYFFKELQVFLFLLIPFLYFVSLFIKEWTQWPVFFLFLLIHFLYFMSLFVKEWIQWLVFQVVRLQLIGLWIY